MNPARLIILAVAVGSAGLAGVLAMHLAGREAVITQVQSVIEKEPTVNVLVASASLPVGTRLSASSLRWMPWPKEAVVSSYVTETGEPEAIGRLEGSIVRFPIFEGEPIRSEKIADADGRVLSSLLPAGKRAVAVEITVATAAGGFILPNDRVDVTMVRKSPNSESYLSETVLKNVRVLAIDQDVTQKSDGSKTVVGTTATLELTPDQGRVLLVAQRMAERLALSLRSVADAQEEDSSTADYLLSGDNTAPLVQIIKSGAIVNDTKPIKAE